MTWLKNRSPSEAALVALLMLAPYWSGCGVKGDPLPPEKPPEMGRGRPTYRRAAEKIELTKDPADDEERN